MSNYPPGVTGNEPQIAGLGERVAEKECLEYLPTVSLLAEDTKTWIKHLAELLERGASDQAIKSAAKYLVRSAEQFKFDYPIEECPYRGPVDIQYDRYMEYWECPVCGTDHEDEDEPPEPLMPWEQ